MRRKRKGLSFVVNYGILVFPYVRKLQPPKPIIWDLLRIGVLVLDALYEQILAVSSFPGMISAASIHRQKDERFKLNPSIVVRQCAHIRDCHLIILLAT